MRFLLDTDVISELRRAPQVMDPGVRAWFLEQSVGDLAISVITVFELEVGVLRMERRDPAQGAGLRRWLEDAIMPGFARRILPLDQSVARRAATRHVADPRPDRDAFVAATADVNRLSVITRNVGGFGGLGVTVIDPWQHGR